MPRTKIGDPQTLLGELERWVIIETPTSDAARVNALMDLAVGGLAEAGVALTRNPGPRRLRRQSGRSHQRASGSEADPRRRPSRYRLVDGHVGDDAFSRRWRPRLRPGILDMKAGSFAAVYAVREIARQRLPTKRPITLLLTPDEEVGSPTSRAIIERESAEAALALIPEPAGLAGVCVTERKGVGRFTLQVQGVGSHAGGAFGDGASAVVELAHQILRLHAWSIRPEASR